MKKTLLILFLSLLSTQGFAKVGDVYYCEMTQAIELKEGRLINYIPQKFKFTIDSDNMIKFGLDSNYFFCNDELSHQLFFLVLHLHPLHQLQLLLHLSLN